MPKLPAVYFCSRCRGAQPSMANGGPRNWSNSFLPTVYQGTAIGRAGIPATEAHIHLLPSVPGNLKSAACQPI